MTTKGHGLMAIEFCPSYLTLSTLFPSTPCFHCGNARDFVSSRNLREQ